MSTSICSPFSCVSKFDAVVYFESLTSIFCGWLWPRSPSGAGQTLETVVVVWSSRPLTKTLYSRRRGWECVGIWDAAFANSYDDMHRAQWSRRGQMFDSFQWLSALIQKHQITHWLHTDTLSSVSADWEGQRQSHCPVTMNTSRLTLIQETC